MVANSSAALSVLLTVSDKQLRFPDEAQREHTREREREEKKEDGSGEINVEPQV